LEQCALGATGAKARPVVRVLDEGLTTAAVATRATAGAVFLGDDLETLRCVAAFGPDARRLLDRGAASSVSLIRRALRTKRSHLESGPELEPQFSSQSKHRTEELLLASLSDDGKLLGVMQLVNPGESRKFSEHDARVVEGVCRTVTTALVQTSSLRRQEGLAAHDPLTGLRNVRELNRELAKAVGSARRAGRDMALMFVDVDHLKRVNSKLGHSAGSEALKRTGKALDEAVAGVGEVFRFGGDEFVVLQKQASKESASALANHLRSHVAASTVGPMRAGGELPKITVSIGVAMLHGLRHLNGQPPRELRSRLMTTADRALFRAKGAGRNRVVLATARDDRS
jgi:diguanylate cyclase (GGDEF)-like protein